MNGRGAALCEAFKPADALPRATMMVGHAALAFALAATLAWAVGVERRRAAAVGLVAAGFGTVPDVDMAYALVGAVGGGVGGVWHLVDGFWAGSQISHRGPTHSLLVGAAVAAIAAGTAVDRRWRRAATLGGLGIVVGVAAVSGAIAAGSTLLLVAAAIGVATVATSGFGFSHRTVAWTAAVGLLSHPFGDVFTGEPPAFLYPFDAAPFDGRVALTAEPTINLVAVFLLELAVIWIALVVAFRLWEHRLVPHVGARAALGATFVAAFFLLQPPTLQRSYHFVFTAVGFAVVGVLSPPLLRHRRLHDLVAGTVTALATVTFAVAVYGAVYTVHATVL